MKPIFVQNKPSYTINPINLYNIYGNGIIQAQG